MLFYIYLLFLYSGLYRLFLLNTTLEKNNYQANIEEIDIAFFKKIIYGLFQNICRMLDNKYYAKALTFDHWELI